MRLHLLVFFLLMLSFTGRAQDVIEREYFSGARAKNAAIAAARYAEEAYYYARFSTFVYAVDSSRSFADTSLFFLKRAEMLSDTSQIYLGKENPEAENFLLQGDQNIAIADSLIRDFYPMIDIRSHHYYGKMSSMYISEATMDYFNASLHIAAGDSLSPEEQMQFAVLPYQDEVERLEADEAAFQLAANEMDSRIKMISQVINRLDQEIQKAPTATERKRIGGEKRKFVAEFLHVRDNLRGISNQLASIKQLLERKYLSEAQELDQAHTADASFETNYSAASAEQVVLDARVPDGLVYKIQLGYYPRTEDIENFYGLFPITGETVGEDLMRVYAGLFYSYTKASEGKKYISEKLLPNAFIVPFYNGEKISNSRAIELERLRATK